MIKLILLFILAPFAVACTQYALVRDGLEPIPKYKTAEELFRDPDTVVQAVLTAANGTERREFESLLYQNTGSREKVIDFYTDQAGSRELAEIILFHAEENGIFFSLAFSLVRTESSYNPGAVNRNRTSTDRGLFQLNSNSFPHMKEEHFFDPAINAEVGLGYLRSCLDLGGNEIVGLAMYNAGRTRVSREGAPRMTLDYIAKILDHRAEIEKQFYQIVILNKNNSALIAGILDRGTYKK